MIVKKQKIERKVSAGQMLRRIGFSMNIRMKRFISLLQVICMMFTMTGCSELGSVATGLFQIVMKLLGYGVIIGVMWVVDLVTWPFVEKTGFNVNKTGDELCLKWTNLIAPDDSHEDWGGYFVIRDEEKLYRKLFQHALNHPEKMKFTCIMMLAKVLTTFLKNRLSS